MLFVYESITYRLDSGHIWHIHNSFNSVLRAQQTSEFVVPATTIVLTSNNISRSSSHNSEKYRRILTVGFRGDHNEGIASCIAGCGSARPP
jgi:hypothetical protein